MSHVMSHVRQKPHVTCGGSTSSEVSRPGSEAEASHEVHLTSHEAEVKSHEAEVKSHEVEVRSSASLHLTSHEAEVK